MKELGRQGTRVSGVSWGGDSRWSSSSRGSFTFVEGAQALQVQLGFRAQLCQLGGLCQP